MKNLLTLVTILVCTGTALAGTGAITGQVTDRATGNPILGAVVAARGENGSGEARTDDHGNYAIRGLAAGQYRVGAEARGYEPAGFGEPVVVRPEQATRNINFALRPRLNHEPGAIAGRVVDARTNEPIARAIVVAAGENGRAKVRTDERGHYVIRGLRPGVYRVAADVRFYRPATQPRPVIVREGEVTRDVDFSLVPQPKKGAILGRVVDARTGRPIGGAIVVASGEQGMARVKTDPRGCYKLGGLTPGLYRVTAAKVGYETQSFPRPVAVRPGARVKDIDFALRHGSTDQD